MSPRTRHFQRRPPLEPAHEPPPASLARRAQPGRDDPAGGADARPAAPRPNAAMIAYLDARRLGPLGIDGVRRGR